MENLRKGRLPQPQKGNADLYDRIEEPLKEALAPPICSTLWDI